ncbi:MAG TPA: hypothetical protein VHR88_08805 [Solirubrobacteraceae bacterium]|jgi:Tol biopolymer transport system component|nr:hypothetical protein [Solirubrobacteraceae bacterium]
MASTGAPGDGDSKSPSVSADGRFVAFASEGDNLSPDDSDATTDVYVRDLVLDTTTLVSRATGVQGSKGRDGSDDPSISADGRLVAFDSDARLTPGSDGGVYVRDVVMGQTSLVSRASGAHGAPGNGDLSLSPSISADGRFVAFDSDATNLSRADRSDDDDVFVRDLQAQTTTLVSRDSGRGGPSANDDAELGAISADGEFVAFDTGASNLVHAGPRRKRNVFVAPSVNVYVRSLATHTTTLVSRVSGPNGAPGDGDSASGSISADGRVVAFISVAANLSPDRREAADEVFVRDLDAQTTTLISASGDSKGDDDSESPSLSADGRLVVFVSSATNLAPEATGGVFVHELAPEQEGATSTPSELPWFAGPKRSVRGSRGGG